MSSLLLIRLTEDPRKHVDLPAGQNSYDEIQVSTMIRLWSLGLAFSGLLMITTMFVETYQVAMAILAMNGVSWAVANLAPFALIGQVPHRSAIKSMSEHSGLRAQTEVIPGGCLTGLHNVAISAPQLLAAGICSLVVMTAEDANSPLSSGWVLFTGAFAYATAAFTAYRASRDTSLTLQR